MCSTIALFNHCWVIVVLNLILRIVLNDLSLVALVAGISKTSENMVQTCDISNRWAGENHLETVGYAISKHFSKCNFSWSLRTSPL